MLRVWWDTHGDAHDVSAEIDQSPAFPRPAQVRGQLQGQVANAEFNLLDAGIAIGRRYYVHLSSVRGALSLLLDFHTASPPIDLARFRENGWALAGRPWLARYSGLSWDGAARRWKVDSTWPFSKNDVAQRAYYIEYAVRPRLESAQMTDSVTALDELAQFYLAYMPRFTTLGELRSRRRQDASTALLDGQGDNTARTLAWEEQDGKLIRIRECTLCNSQFFHPASRLIRLIAEMPPERRTERMTQFVKLYTGLIVHEHLVRLAFEASWDYWGDRTLPPKLIDIWQTIIRGGPRPQHAYQRSMTDRDLWLTATAAEMLGAHAADPSLIPLGADSAKLREIVDVGTDLFKKKTLLQRIALAGKAITTADYFAGDNDDHPDMAYAGDTADAFPRPADSARVSEGSWDVSHAYRIPVFLRSLFDVRRVLGLRFPVEADLQVATDTYFYRAFDGNMSKPSFRNFMDGRDGWFRVGYGGRTGTGYAPSGDCDARLADRACLASGAIQGWGLLGFASNNVRNLEVSIMRLAVAPDSASRSFRDRVYTVGKEPFSDAIAGRPIYPFFLYAFASEFCEIQWP